MKQRGFTLSELLACIGLLAWLSLIGLGIWAVVHFIAKFW